MMRQSCIVNAFVFYLIMGSFLHAKTIIVTGGAGFIGSHVAEQLLGRGDAVIIIDNLHDYYSQSLKRQNLTRLSKLKNSYLLKIYEIDICDFCALEEIVSTSKVDVICHLAACAGVRASVEHPELYLRTNVIGTLYILELAKKHAIPHLVIASSSSVYGNYTEAPFSEQYKADMPCSPYAATKRADELLAYTYHYLFGISSTCLRFFTVYGPSGRPDMAPFKFMDFIHRGKTIQQYGDGSSIRDFTYVDDIVDGIVRALDIPLGYEVINLGRGEPVTLSDFIATLQIVMNKKAIIEVVAKPKSDVDMTHADISKARNLLGYSPKTSLKEGLQKTYAWYINDYLSLVAE